MDEWETALIDGGLVLLLFVLPYQIAGDAIARFDALTELLGHGRLTASAYSDVGPLFAAPLYYLGTLWGDPVWWCQRYNTLLVAGGFGALSLLFRDPDERAVIRPFFLILLAASMFPNHLTNFNSEPFTAIAVMVGVAAISAGRSTLGWTLTVLGVANTPAALGGLGLVAAKRAIDRKQLTPLLAVAAAVTLIAVEAWIRRGGPFVTGYEANAGVRTVMPYSGLPGFSYPAFFGLLSILFSFGKGLVFYAPGLLLPVPRASAALPPRLRECYQNWLLFLVGLIAVYAKWWAWYGGTSWGPRFFLFASIPASLALAVTLRRTGATRWAIVGVVALLALSSWVAIDGAVFGQANLGICQQNDWAQEFLCWYVPEFSALWRPFVAPSPVSSSGLLFIAFSVAVCATLIVSLFRPGHSAPA
jgi:hypothetical protein